MLQAAQRTAQKGALNRDDRGGPKLTEDGERAHSVKTVEVVIGRAIWLAERR
jgi:hypothetical protein